MIAYGISSDTKSAVLDKVAIALPGLAFLHAATTIRCAPPALLDRRLVLVKALEWGLRAHPALGRSGTL
jgi:hypothetical protein